MTTPTPQWQLPKGETISTDWVNTVQTIANFPNPPKRAAELLWQRGIRTAEQLTAFINPDVYEPMPPASFGGEMTQAVERILQALENEETVTIWGDFDADGITSTAVLWDGLRQFFPAGTLNYFIPNRLTESHGLSVHGLDAISADGTTLVITCDNGSTNLTEIDHAQTLGMDVIITDHHTLPDERPTVVAIINPRYFESGHPLAHLSGVAVAFKLVEALYARLTPTRPLSELTDLVAIGLIADLVQLSGDCRYLAQIGIRQLQTHLKTDAPIRPGVAELLKLCRRTGDRPTDISFGIGPRINAVSRIHGDAQFCVDLLTSEDADHCHKLAQQTEWANTRRKALQKDVHTQVTQRLTELDMATVQVIVLADAQWPTGVLGIVAGQVAQEYGKPTILLTIDGDVARGSARSVNRIDLYQLVTDQSHLLTSFGGHPFAAGMTLPLENVSLFADALNRQLRQVGVTSGPTITIDLEVSVCELGRNLFQQLNLLEPYGMGNPVPRLLVRNAWFDNTWHQKIKDPVSKQKLRFIKTHFLLKDDTAIAGFPGLWWGHYKDDLPIGRCDVVLELDFNTYSRQKKPQYGGYEVRLLDVRSVESEVAATVAMPKQQVIDCRAQSAKSDLLDALVVTQCPTTWQELRPWFHQATQQQTPLVLAYENPEPMAPVEVWKRLVGIAKYLTRTETSVTMVELMTRLELGEVSLRAGLVALGSLGFRVRERGLDETLDMEGSPLSLPIKEGGINRGDLQSLLPSTTIIFLYDEAFAETPEQQQASLRLLLASLREEQFQRRYFSDVPVSVAQTVMEE
ncbi:single-stranded-DNA-specific exonuclease RecJ [Leptothoe spongobia]|uniref:Single-stranded-DNA-specific exonuclease RecJ n=1 Tax=Leptothoe spongobia TAU-MAC 1115 TaxID=1967444 RepID=A0A947GJC5_9CYAN|nr:single-stranded-DNA-specific exonuclease RecJ [Leptothoe spongobia]MBT9315838.1 single-stranded-DNA-specific exonuclease RecJ [Leptothoe spongobia TAU-MAC 1115]